MGWELLPEIKKIISGKWADGACGPCSEDSFMICVQKRAQDDSADKSLVNADHPQLSEIMESGITCSLSRLKNGNLESLRPSMCDTGMGFERLPMITFIAQKAGIQYGADERTDIAMRVLSDHIRAVSFAIADGQLPSNNKAGYVIRRILRRAVRYAYTFLNFKTPFITNWFFVS
ncbi:hypothetical protein FQR65_LT18695 [Abscondita terminalis]|nr:hypothetical protein FQR65_LT18695 [Abscondita terminalis]